MTSSTWRTGVSWSIFTVICSVFQVFPAVYKLRHVDISSRRKIREMEEEEKEIRRNGGEVGKGKICKHQEDNL